MKNKITLPLPEELQKKLEERIEGTDFASVTDYIIFILGEITSKKDEERQFYTEEEEKDIQGNPNLRLNKENKKREGYSEEDEAELKQELEDLGYM